MTALRPHEQMPTTGNLRLWSCLDGDAVVVTLRGEIDMASTPDLRQTLVGLINTHPRCVVVSMAGVTFLDATGLGALVVAHNEARTSRSSLRLVGVNGEPAKVLQLTGLTRVFPIWDSVEAALTA